MAYFLSSRSTDNPVHDVGLDANGDASGVGVAGPGLTGGVRSASTCRRHTRSSSMQCAAATQCCWDGSSTAV
nr:unnamed protein product [Digitaria exilis]